MIKKGDNIIVIAGSQKGKKAKVMRVDKASGRVFLDGLNMKKKHQKARRGGEKGQIMEIPHSITLSNVMIYENGKATRLGSKMVGGKKIRISKKSGNEI